MVAFISFIIAIFSFEFVPSSAQKAQKSCDAQSPRDSTSHATWPAGPNQVSDCPKEMRLKQCVEYFRENKAMVEVFFEELAYEYLLESEAYGVANLLADFGGQLGLWMGVSVITCIELMVFIWGLCIKCCNLCSNKKQSNNSMSFDEMSPNDKPLSS